jgi:hypothetical protein
VVKPELTSSYYSAPAVCYRNFFQKSLSDSWRKKENSTPFISFDVSFYEDLFSFDNFPHCRELHCRYTV